MRKVYFGKNKEKHLNAIYVVKLLDSELEKFAAHMNKWGFEKYQYIPEIMDCKENETAICYDINDWEEKVYFENAYADFKQNNHTGKTREVKVIQGYYDGEWSDICEYEKNEYKELKADFKSYQDNEPIPHRIITRRVKN